jgi:hypothetical protein
MTCVPCDETREEPGSCYPSIADDAQFRRLAMTTLALVGVIGLVAALFLPANPVAEGVGGSPD